MNWIDEIIDAYEDLGGAARHPDLYAYIERTTNRYLTKHWRASVRRTLQQHSTDSDSYVDGYPDLLQHIGRGFWALRGRTISEEFIQKREDMSPEEVVDLVLVSEHWRRKPGGRSQEAQKLQISHADTSPFEGAGLRSFFEYRQTGIAEGTGGAYGAHVIRAVPGDASAQEWHTHVLDFQFVFVTKGWVEFEYEGHGTVMLRAGSSVLQPPGIVHREVRHSDDMELLEITSPAEFETHPAEAPT